MTRKNHLGQPIGEDVPGWTAAKWPERRVLKGRYCSIEPLSAKDHARALYDAYAKDEAASVWTYMYVGPFDNFADFETLIAAYEVAKDPYYFTILDTEGEPIGIASLMRIKPDAGSIEVGGIAYAPVLQRTPAATEAMSLLMRYAFEDLGYRRYEWKCDALNAPSRRAAIRLGFQYEGLFRQALVYKGRNRDTAWFAITDQDWPKIKAAHDAWLSPDNFDSEGTQRQSLSTLISSC